MKITTIYSDLDNRLDVSKKNGLVINTHSIEQAIQTFFCTDEYGRFFRPDVFCGLDEHVFDLIDRSTALSIFAVLLRLDSLLPAFLLDRANTQVIPRPDDNRYDIVVYYTIDGLSDGKFEYRGEIGR